MPPGGSGAVRSTDSGCRQPRGRRSRRAHCPTHLRVSAYKVGKNSPRAVAGDLEAEHISEVILNRVLVYPSVSVPARALSALQLIRSLASCQNVAGLLAFGRRNAKFGRLTQTSLPEDPLCDSCVKRAE